MLKMVENLAARIIRIESFRWYSRDYGMQTNTIVLARTGI